ncbi:exodeoxyribonuclease VII large subunit [Macrococcus sp. DPC7161]|uniref:exodeoxyribonuclease VII large subunit n=1 Tax=Macrococcus sp. DPC7161 TaxID=2507060 RepID=UPI00100A66EE|nr:exodeoxyribonuclease VII large subunit [Macrococcus sp. DPC7161]RXK19336.1 exodeoxyribonuclease VII large subunit [Macrococcus sp. DPC7161]
MEQYLSVSALTKYIKTKFEVDPYLQQMYVSGEISNFKHHSSGHMYFAMKEANAVINCMMYKAAAQKLTFKPKDGDQILVKGRVTVYESRGSYQLYVQEMSLDGVGLLYEKFEQLKKSFEEKGYFDKQHKKPIPKYPKHIIVLTASTGAAVKDIQSTLQRRYPIAEVTYISTLVQGEGAKENIVENLKKADTLNADVIILGRGGGSIEDLWAFNESVVVEAIFQTNTPIISAVGHETDTTLSDFVADLRAPTPTGAAELATPNINDLYHLIQQSKQYLNQQMKRKIDFEKAKLKRYTSHYLLQNPEMLIIQRAQRRDELSYQLTKNIDAKMNAERHRIAIILQHLKPQLLEHTIVNKNNELQKHQQLLSRIINNTIENHHLRLKHQLLLLNTLSPTQTMLRGYGIVKKENDVIQSVHDVSENEEIQIHLRDGQVDAKVININEVK